MLKKMIKQTLKVINFKISDDERKVLKQKALQYTGGNVSEWLRYAAMNHVPKPSELDKKAS